MLYRLFEERCLAIMDRLYEEDTRSAIDLMDDVSSVWGIKSSPLNFAHENFLYDVVAHPCSQKNMNLLWYNNLAPDLKPFMKVRLLKIRIIFLHLIPYFCGFFPRKSYLWLIKYFVLVDVSETKEIFHSTSDEVHVQLCMSLVYLRCYHGNN
jgi:hypothetical protein